MSSSSTDPETNRPLTRQDIAAALISLANLPKRVAPNAAVEFEGFRVALEGVTGPVLAAAVRAILQGALGHGFYPSPPELRIQCDAIQRLRQQVADRERRIARQREEARAFPAVSHSEASKAKVAEVYRKFCQDHAAAKLAEAQRGWVSGTSS